jgi:UDP:flavonoid glycosyltransferase YjiC (YdhE family)
VKILFGSLPAFGHLYPLMPLANAAREASHDVHVATTGPFRAKLSALGFATHDVGVSIEQAIAQVLAECGDSTFSRAADGRPDPEFGVRMFVDVHAHRTAADLAPVLREVRPDLVVYEQYDIGVAVAARAAGIPALCHSISPFTPIAAIGEIAHRSIERLWDVHAPGDVGSYDVYVGDGYLDIVPDALQLPSFRDHPARRAIRPVPYAEPGALVPSWLTASERPVVYLTLGTIVATDDVLAPAIEGLAQLDAEILVALGSAVGAGLGTVPTNVHVESFVDQASVLACADLAVHHGGSGTMLSAFALGVPQLLLPKGADQFENADTVVAADLAAVLEPSEATPDAIATAATTSLQAARPGAERVREQIAAMPSPADVLADLCDEFGHSGVTVTTVA